MNKIYTLIISTVFTISSMVAQQKQSFQIQKKAYLKINNLNVAKAVEEEPIVPKRKCIPPVVNPQYEAYIQDYMQKQQQFANGKKAAVVYNIPIIFHIVYVAEAVGTGKNLSLTQINSQITRLNEDYRKTNIDQATYLTQPAFTALAADCEINFCAAKVDPNGNSLAEPGVDRIAAASKGWTTGSYTDTYIDATIKPNSFWDPTKYYNVWVLDLGTSLLGYAQFPGFGAANTDGVAVHYKYTGISTFAPYNKGRTLTHETGHWLGLFHIWGDDGTSCSGSDNVTDTPNQADENYTCPTTAGSVVVDACSTTTPGVLYQNYMDYSDDKCMVMFTTGQKAKMQAVMATSARRASLNASNVCTSGVGINEKDVFVELNLFPNPTNGELNVTVDLLNTEDYTLIVINTLGQIIKEVKQLRSNGGVVKLDLSSNPNGMYFVTVKTKSGSQTKRVVLQ